MAIEKSQTAHEEFVKETIRELGKKLANGEITKEEYDEAVASVSNV